MIGFLVGGFVIGACARLVRPGRKNIDLVSTLGLGIVGALVGGLIARSFPTGRLFERDVASIVLAVGVAVLFIGGAEGIAARRAGTAPVARPRNARELGR